MLHIHLRKCFDNKLTFSLLLKLSHGTTAKLPVKYYVVDAFTDTAFKGNPAAVCFIEEERDEKWLQAVAAEFNFAETCYLTRLSGSDSLDSSNPRFRLRWFTPVVEDHVCGSANCALALYWNKRLGKCDLVAYAASARSGVVYIHLDEQNQRVLLRGKAVTIMEGSLSV